MRIERSAVFLVDTVLLQNHWNSDFWQCNWPGNLKMDSCWNLVCEAVLKSWKYKNQIKLLLAAPGSKRTPWCIAVVIPWAALRLYHLCWKDSVLQGLCCNPSPGNLLVHSQYYVGGYHGSVLGIWQAPLLKTSRSCK